MNDQKVKISVEAKDKTAGELAKTRNEFDKTAATAKKVNKILAAKELLGVKPYKDIQREIKRLQAAYNRLKRDGKTSAADLYQAKVKLKQKTAELRKETGDWAGQLGKAKVGIAGLAAAGYLFVKSFQQYSEFSQRMGEVNTLIDVSQERFAALGREIRDLTKDIPQTASELAAAEYDILSAGVALEKSVGVLEKSAKAAVAGVTDTKTAANAGLAVINAYGKSIDELDGVYDTLFQTVKLGVTTFPQLAQSIGEVLPTAKAANVPIKDVTASIAALTKAGIRTPQAMTALKGAINAMAAPAPEAKKQFEALGITWEGLIPTLDKIREKGLSIDQMRLLIPDVEARTGVLALTQNYDELVEILGEMRHASGAMEDAYDKMADTPENQIKLFRNEIDDLTLSVGALVSKGLLPATKALREGIDSIKEIDPVTKGFVGTLTAAIVGFTIWRTGLKFILSGLGGFAGKAVAAQAAAGGLMTQLSASGFAMKTGLAAAAAYAVIEIGRAVRAYLEMREAMAVEEEAQNRLYANTDRLMNKYKEFKSVRLPADMTKLAQSDLEGLRKKLVKARAYYTALKMKADELGQTKALAKINSRLKEINDDLKRVGEAASDAAGDMKKPAEAIEFTSDTFKEFEKQAKKAYEEAKKQAADYAEQVIAWEEKIQYARLSTEDKIRELGRKGMEEEIAWADKKLEAEEKLYAAKEAMARGDYELAEKLAKDAEGLYADLATEIKKTEGGTDVIVKSLEDTKEVAVNGVQEVGKFVEELYTKQRDSAEKSKNEWQKTAEVINKKLDEIAKEREANVVIQLKQLEAAQNAINRLIEDKTVHIKVITHHVDAKRAGGIVEAHRHGGIAGSLINSTASILRAAAGKILPGYGGGDKVNIIAEAGEGILRKEAVSGISKEFFYAYNSLNIPAMLSELMKKKLLNISLPEMMVPKMTFAGGGIAPAGTKTGNETFTLRLQAGNVEMPLTVQGESQTMRAMVKEFEQELIKMSLSRK